MCFAPGRVRNNIVDNLRKKESAYYRSTRNMAATIERGRWATVRVARIYINDGLAKEVELRLPLDVASRLRARVRTLKTALR